MRPLALLGACLAALTATGCTDMCFFGCHRYASTYEFVAPFEDYQTNVVSGPVGYSVVGYYIPENLERALHLVEIRDSAGQVVPAKVEVVGTQTDAGSPAAWCPLGQYANYGDEIRCSVITPEAPLAPGWYTLQPGPDFYLSFQQGTPPTVHFHVGSFPMIVSVGMNTKGGGLTATVRLSEPIALTNFDAFVALQELGGSGKCRQSGDISDAPQDMVWLKCDFSIDSEVQVVVKPGLTSADGAPLQDLGGLTEFWFMLGPKTVDRQYNIGMREWHLGNRH